MVISFHIVSLTFHEFTLGKERKKKILYDIKIHMSVFPKVNFSFYCIFTVTVFPQTSSNVHWMSFSPARCKEQEERAVQSAAL